MRQDQATTDDDAIEALVLRIQRTIDDAIAARHTTTREILNAIKARGAT
jgi:hypothetical protein